MANSPNSIHKTNILVGCTGSVASLKIPLLVEELLKMNHEVEVQVIPTERALHFFDASSLEVKVHRDVDEWQLWQKRTDPVLHIDLRKWADLMILAPLDANTLAKVANGLCDNLLTCVVRAWDMKKPVLFAPSMNTHMWDHPITAQHVAILKSWGFTEIPCVEKLLVCGDRGLGAMAEVKDIVAVVEGKLNAC